MIKKKLVQCIKCPEGKLCVAWKTEYVDGEKRYWCQGHWNQKKYADKKVKLKTISDTDSKFYDWVWKMAAHECAECGKQLTKPDKGDARNYIHHILAKSKYPYWRHDKRNTIVLCWSCHQAAESATSYPKMKVYFKCEQIKEKLLNEVGLNYNHKQLA